MSETDHEHHTTRPTVDPTVDPTVGPAIGLTDREQKILDIEDTMWPGVGAKANAVERRLGVSLTEYVQQLNRLLDTERALQDRPVLVNRLRRQRETLRRMHRFARLRP